MSLDIDLIRSSFEKAKPIAQDVVNQFYEFLFSDYPEAKPLFEGVQMENQKSALLNSLVYIVDHLDRPDKLIPYLQKMGGRHVDYGTEEEHYPLVGQTLLKTFAHFFGDDWTEELQEEWTKAYMFIAEQMLIGAREQSPDLESIKGKAQEVCEDLLVEILENQIDERFIELARSRVRRILLDVLKEESQKLVKKKVA